jgi:hypothetical protein
VINVRLLALGTRVDLSNGSTAEIVSNPKDGDQGDVSLVGTEEMVFAQDIVGIQD